MKRSILLLALILITIAPAVAEAQIRVARGRVGVGRARWYRGVGAVGAYRWGYGYRGTSAIGDARRGMADVIRARGAAAESASKATINYQEAQSRYIDNKLKWTKTYHERKRLGEAAQREKYARERAKRQKYLAKKRSTPHPRLTASQLDPYRGKIYWPELLQQSDFAKLRTELDELLILRAHTSTTPDLGEKIFQRARAMQEILKEKIKTVPVHQYISARTFLNLLVYEGRHPPA